MTRHPVLLLGIALLFGACANAPVKDASLLEVAHLNVRRYLLLQERPFAKTPTGEQVDLELLLVQMGDASTVKVSVHITQQDTPTQVWSNETLSDSLDALDMAAGDDVWGRASRFAVVRLNSSKARIHATVGQLAEVSREVDISGAKGRTWMIQIMDGQATIAPCEIR